MYFCIWRCIGLGQRKVLLANVAEGVHAVWSQATILLIRYPQVSIAQCFKEAINLDLGILACHTSF